MLYKVDGSVIDTKCKIIVQQVGCHGIMGYGLQIQIRSRWPTVYDQYREFCSLYEKTHRSPFGRVNYADTEDGHIVASCFTQVMYGHGVMRSERTDLAALEACISDIADYAYEYEMTVAFPYKLGCDISDEEWDSVQGMIEKYFCWSNTRCYTYQYD